MRNPSFRRLCSVISTALPLIWGASSAPTALAAWLRNGVPICTEIHRQDSPVIVPDGSHGAIVVWQDRRFGGGDIFAQRVDSSGVVQWSTNGISVDPSGNAYSPSAVPGPGGGAIIFWTEGTSNSDIYAQRIDGQGIPQWTSNGVPLATSSDSEYGPLAIPDGSFGIVAPVGWIVLFHRVGSSGSGLSLQHVNANGVGLWTPASSGGVTLISRSDSFILNDALASDGVGPGSLSKGAIVAWSEQMNSSSTGFDVYARRIDSSGTPQWISNGVLICGLAGDQGTSGGPGIVNVGSGNVIVAWDDNRTGDRDLWAQKLDTSGNQLWLANGLPICRASGGQSLTKLISDGAGGVIAAWQDGRSAQSKIFAQRLDGNGQHLWDLDGIAICPAGGLSQANPAIVTDGSGGAIIAWEDFRASSTPDIWAQRVDANGNLLWPATGIPLTTAAGIQEHVGLVGDGANGAIGAWQQYIVSVDSADVYANRVTATGGVVDAPATSRPTKLRLVFVSSNPTRGEIQMRLDLPEAAFVTAEVLDALGRRVRSLDVGSHLDAGSHLVTWDGPDDMGAPTAAGVFFVRARVGTEMLGTRVVRLR